MRVKNWDSFQHYKDRSPPWIKLHKALLDDFDFQLLPLASRALAPMLWLLASENMQGDIDNDPKRLAFRLRWSVQEVIDGMKPLLDSGFIVDDSHVLAGCYQSACPEAEAKTEAKTEAKRERDEKKGVASASRLPADWTPSDAEIDYCKTQRPDLIVEKVVENFSDYWHAKGGAAARKVDWSATWRSWVRNEKSVSHQAARLTRHDQQMDTMAALTGGRFGSGLFSRKDTSVAVQATLIEQKVV